MQLGRKPGNQSTKAGELADAALAELHLEENGISRTKKICFDLDKLVSPPADLCIVRLADVGILARIELSRQNREGLVCEDASRSAFLWDNMVQFIQGLGPAIIEAWRRGDQEKGMVAIQEMRPRCSQR